MTAEWDHVPDISVVIASVESARWMRPCLTSVREACRDMQCEILVVDASRDGSADIAEVELNGTEGDAVLRFAPGTLTPELWAAGIGRSRGKVVVLTTAHFAVEPTWISSLTSGLDTGVAGVAGRIDLSDESTVTDWAVFYLRYSEFLDEPDVPRTVPGIPADNAAYDGAAARRFVQEHDDGFWEVEFHREVHAAGRSLAMLPRATARYGRSFPFGTIARHRFHHGRHAGAWQVATGQRSALGVIIAAPIVPLALAARVWRRVRRSNRHLSRFLRALPTFLVLATFWSAGEAFGAVTGAPARRPTPVPA